MNSLKVLGKFLDQPLLVSNFQKSVPLILGSATVAYTSYETYKTPDYAKKKQALKTGITLGTTAISAIAAPKIASSITKRAMPATVKAVRKQNSALVDSFTKDNKISNDIGNTLIKAKDKVLKYSEVKKLYKNLNSSEEKHFLEKLIPSPENISAKDIFSEIGYLSIYGAVPVVGGITGGIIADKTTEKSWRKNIPDKIKEGAYQYLANIFLCNIGAAAALGVLEKFGIKSKAARALGMTLGIILTGVIGGSKAANIIGKKVIDPICKNTKREENKERTPEVLDISLHTDDIATVSLLSGLKWIEPALPLMYSISGYRAGIGYRN